MLSKIPETKYSLKLQCVRREAIKERVETERREEKKSLKKTQTGIIALTFKEVMSGMFVQKTNK